MTALETFGPTPAGAGADLGQDFYIRTLGPMLRGYDGIDAPPTSNSLQAYGNNSGRQAFVRPGRALIRGEGYTLDGDDMLVTFPTNTSGSTRVDRIVIRHDPTAGDPQGRIVRIAGTPGAGAPALTRVAGGTWDIPVAKVTCINGFTGLGPADVSDDRQLLAPAVPYTDSSKGPLPPVDGSQGRLCWDLSPSVNGLLSTNGVQWTRQVTTSDLNVDGGWVDLGTFGGFAAFYGGTRYRKIGRLVEVRAHILGIAENYTITALPDSMKPDDIVYARATCDDGAADWQVRIPYVGDTTPLELQSPSGRGVTGRTFFISHTYFAG